MHARVCVCVCVSVGDDDDEQQDQPGINREAKMAKQVGQSHSHSCSLHSIHCPLVDIPTHVLALSTAYNSYFICEQKH